MSIKCEVWGKTPDGKEVHKFTMTNAMGASVSVIEWGAICTSIIVPDAGGNLDDVALGFDTLEKYLAPHGSMGDTIGRYGNRIGAGRFSIDGQEYQVALNDHGVNHLHGGNVGFSSHFWDGTPKEEEYQDSVSFHRISPDGEENYPGNLDSYPHRPERRGGRKRNLHDRLRGGCRSRNGPRNRLCRRGDG